MIPPDEARPLIREAREHASVDAGPLVVAIAHCPDCTLLREVSAPHYRIALCLAHDRRLARIVRLNDGRRA